jgi:hypothetical protein
MNHRRATTNKKLRLSRGIAAIAGAAIVSGTFALPADAAQPANQACLGKSFSALAGPGFGQGIVSFLPRGPLPGFGDSIDALQAGRVPDSLVPNTCYNP